MPQCTLLLTKYSICRLCSFPKGERLPWLHHPDPGHLDKYLGKDHQDFQHRKVRRRLPPIVRAKQKVYAYRRWLCEEIL
jgi:hypothetical protein